VFGIINGYHKLRYLCYFLSEEQTANKVLARLLRSAESSTKYGSIAPKVMSPNPRVDTLSVRSLLFMSVPRETTFVLFIYSRWSPIEARPFLSFAGVSGMFFASIDFLAPQHRFVTLQVDRGCMIL